MRVNKWTLDGVCACTKSIKGMQEDVVDIFKKNRVLTLDINGLKMMGIESAGTLCLLKN